MSGGGHDDEPHEEHEEHVNHEAWVIPYADLLTLLMAMFIALYAMGSVDKDKFKELSLGFNEALNGDALTAGVFAPQEGNSLVPGTGQQGSNGSLDSDGGDVGPGKDPSTNSIAALLKQQENIQVAKAAERESLQNVKDRLQGDAERLGVGDKLKFELRDDGLHVTIVTDEVLFASGSAEIQTGGDAVLRLVADALGDVENPILIGGHTDNQPISTEQFPSNWELSGARSSAVLRFLAEHGLGEADLQATGYADTRPIATNETAEGRAKNRRVEVVIQSRVVGALLDANGLTNDPTPDSENPQGPGEGPVDVGQSIEDIVGDLADEA